MKQVIFFLFFSFIFFARAQQNLNHAPLSALNKIDIGLRGIGISTERVIGTRITLNIALSVGGGYEITPHQLNYKLNWNEPVASVSLNPRFYYKREERKEKGRNAALNAGNYWGVTLKYATRGLTEGSLLVDALLMDGHWGLQRPVSKRWLFHGKIGLGYALDATDLQNSSGTFYPALDLGLSFAFGRKAKFLR